MSKSVHRFKDPKKTTKLQSKDAKKKQNYASQMVDTLPSRFQNKKQSQYIYYSIDQPVHLNQNNHLSQEFTIRQKLQQSKNKPLEALSFLLEYYRKQPQAFYRQGSGHRKNIPRFIFELIGSLVDHKQSSNLLKFGDVENLFGGTLQWIREQKAFLLPCQQKFIFSLTEKVWNMLNQTNKILQKTLIFILKIPILLIQVRQNQIFAYQLLKTHMNKLVIFARQKKRFRNLLQNSFQKFYEQTLIELTRATSQIQDIIPLLQFAALSFGANQTSLFVKIMQKTFICLQTLIMQSTAAGGISNIQPQQSLVGISLICCSLFKFGQQQNPNIQKYSDDVILMIMLTYRSNFIKIIDLIQKIDKHLVKDDVVRGMFLMAQRGSHLNSERNLIPIISRILKISRMKELISKDFTAILNLQSEQKISMQILQTISKIIQKSLFQILYRIQKTLTAYNLQIFVDLYTKNPTVLRSQYFIKGIFQKQNHQVILKFMIKLTSTHLVNDLQMFNYSYYLFQLLSKCILQQKIYIIGRFLKGLTPNQLLKVNDIIFKLSFNCNSKVSTVCCSSLTYNIAQLTSAGYSQQSILINQIMPTFSQQLQSSCLLPVVGLDHSYLYVKAFYHVITHQFILTKDIQPLLEQVIKKFNQNIQEMMMEQTFSSFQLLFCLLCVQDSCHNFIDKPFKQKMQKIILKIILQRYQRITTMYQTVINQRSSALSQLAFNDDIISTNMKSFARSRLMNQYFLKILYLWIDNLRDIQDIIPNKMGSQKVLQIIMALSTNMQGKPCHSIRCLSSFGGNKVFYNLISLKSYNKDRKEKVSLTNVCYLKQLILAQTGIYYPQMISDQFTLSQNQILEYFHDILWIQVQAGLQKQLLKTKIIVLDCFSTLIRFHSSNLANSNQNFLYFYKEKLKQIILELTYQNPKYISKYQKDYILQIRLICIQIILSYYGTPFQILSRDQLFLLVFELSLDRFYQIRLCVLSFMTSAIKKTNIQKEKRLILAILTFISAFQPQLSMKIIANNILQPLKQSKNRQVIAISTLLTCFQLILGIIKKNISRNDSGGILVDCFINHFQKIWLQNKQSQCLVFALSKKLNENFSWVLNIPQSSHNIQSYIERIFINAERSDYRLQKQIKDQLRKQLDFSFQAYVKGQPAQDKVFRSLGLRMFSKIQKLILQKYPYHRKKLSCKKHMQIILQKLLQLNILKLQEQLKNQRNITFTV